MKRKILLLFCVAVLAALILGGVLITKKMDAVPVQGAGTAQNALQKKVTLSYMGTDFPIKKHLQTVLLIGTDSTEQYEEQTEGLRDFYNGHQADFLMLLVLDTDANTAQIIQLNRDTMTEIPILGVAGDEAGSFTGQLALAHTYGSGKADSCFNAAKAVSDLLYGVPVDHFVSMTMDGVARINDLAGGVTVRIEDDFSRVDPSLTEGSQICLIGSQALTYVRARGGMEDSSNLQRMRRQRTYMQALYEKVKTCVEEDENFMTEAAARLSDCMVSDYTANQLAALGNLLSACSMGEILPLEGSAKQGKEFMEFYVDEEALQQTVITLFYEAAEADQQAGS